MGLFAGIIFGEKIWRKGIWIARAAGIGLAVVGILVIAGFLPSLVSGASMISNIDAGKDMQMNNQGDSGKMATNDKSATTSMEMTFSDNSAPSQTVR